MTKNLRDFPDSILAPYNVEAIDPDEFIANELDLYGSAVCESVKIVRARLKNPPKSVDDYLRTLEGQGLVVTAAKLSDFAALL